MAVGRSPVSLAMARPVFVNVSVKGRQAVYLQGSNLCMHARLFLIISNPYSANSSVFHAGGDMPPTPTSYGHLRGHLVTLSSIISYWPNHYKIACYGPGCG